MYHRFQRKDVEYLFRGESHSDNGHAFCILTSEQFRKDLANRAQSASRISELRNPAFMAKELGLRCVALPMRSQLCGPSHRDPSILRWPYHPDPRVNGTRFRERMVHCLLEREAVQYTEFDVWLANRHFVCSEDHLAQFASLDELIEAQPYAELWLLELIWKYGRMQNPKTAYSMVAPAGQFDEFGPLGAVPYVGPDFEDDASTGKVVPWPGAYRR